MDYQNLINNENIDKNNTKLHINIKINNKFSLQYRISRWTNDNDRCTNDNDWWNSAADKSPIRMIEKICCEIDS